MRTHTTTVTYQCDGCKTSAPANDERKLNDVPGLPKGWIQMEDERRHQTHVCPDCLPLVYFAPSGNGRGYSLWRADTIIENAVTTKYLPKETKIGDEPELADKVPQL